jgi:hypothetical protein
VQEISRGEGRELNFDADATDRPAVTSDAVAEWSGSKQVVTSRRAGRGKGSEPARRLVQKIAGSNGGLSSAEPRSHTRCEAVFDLIYLTLPSAQSMGVYASGVSAWKQAQYRI